MNIPDWVFVLLAVAAIAIVIGFDQAERAARWRRDLDKPLSPRARRWATEHQESSSADGVPAARASGPPAARHDKGGQVAQ